MYKTQLLILSIIILISGVSQGSFAQVTEAEGKAASIESALNEGELREARFLEKIVQRNQFQSQMKGYAGNNVLTGSFQHLTPQNTGSNGLSDISVRFVKEDADGNLYFGTRGIDQWSGTEWTFYDQNNTDLPSNTVFDLLQDYDGNIWGATYWGLVRYDMESEEMNVYTPDNSDIRSRFVNALHLGSDSLIYVGHRWDDISGGGITVVNSAGEVDTTLSGENGFYGDSINDFAEDANNNLYVATGADPETGEYGGVNVWNMATASVDTFYNMDNSDLPYNEVNKLAVDDEGNLWIGLYMNNNLGHVEGGLVKFDGFSWSHHLPGNVIRDLELDSNGSLWIAGTEGLFKHDDDTYAEVFDDQDSSMVSVSDITELSDGRIAFSKYTFNLQGGGVSFLDTTNDTWEHITTNDGGVNSLVKFGADYDSQGNLWTTGFHGLQKYDGQTWETWTESDGLAYTYGWDLIVDQNDNVWIGSSANGITKISPDGTIEIIDQYGEFVESNWEATNGDLWFGSWYGDYDSDGEVEAHGILHFDGENYTVYDSTDGLPARASGPILSIAEDQQGRILAATYDGLYRLEDSTFTKWEYDGYNDGSVYKLHYDSQNRLWVSDGAKISMFEGDSTWTHFEEVENLQGYAEDIEEDLDGRIWFVQSYGAAVYDNGEFKFVTHDNGFPTIAPIYDIAPSRTDAGIISFATYLGGMVISDNIITSNESSVSTTLPEGFELNQNYPNPFNPSTKISYALPQTSNVRITVYNAIGQKVVTLLNEVKSAGQHEVTFNANRMNSGMYIYRIEAGNYTQTRKMMLIK